MNKWYNKLQYGAMLLMAAAMPVSWRVGLYVALLLAMVSIVKMIAQRKVGNPALDWRLRIPFFAMLAYWLVITISVFYSADSITGWLVVMRKAVLLIFPLCFLLTDTSYLDGRYLRALGYVLLLSVCAVFLYFSVRAGVSMAEGATWAQVTGSCTFDPRHHAYTALYMAIAIVFVLHEMNRRWQEMKVWYQVILALLMVVCMFYLMIVNSRAGILTLWIIVVSYVVYMALFCKQWMLALMVTLLFAGVQVGVKTLTPQNVNRVESSASEISSGEDARVKIYKSAIHVATEGNPVVGYGAGDYFQSFADKSTVENNGYVAKNIHNQYLETFLSVGIIGLIPFLIWLFYPLYLACRRKSMNLFLLLMLEGVVLFNLLFESMLERQMGLLFIGYLLSVIVLILSLEENKFGRVQKS
ncbi:MAG: O-antigen ligase family protein [Bacteroidales bacterium]|nr:O-antigen ligase family protein [Bacteroidales bacterium]